jgi:hypothetical protein
LSVPPLSTIHPPLGDPEDTAEVCPLLTVVMTYSPQLRRRLCWFG